jgi:hypothetical protein
MTDEFERCGTLIEQACKEAAARQPEDIEEAEAQTHILIGERVDPLAHLLRHEAGDHPQITQRRKLALAALGRPNGFR